MEQDIKNFDRSIEKIVHEQEIAPPFGVWNRISAELDALPAGETAPFKTLIPKRAFTGIIAAAIVLGVSVGTAYIMNNVFVKDKPTHVVNAPQRVTSIASAAAVNAEPVTKPANIVSDENTTQPLMANAKHNHHNTIAKTGKSKTNMPLVSASPEPVMNVNALAPRTIKSVNNTPGELAQAFYFPPVDRTISDGGAPEKIALNRGIKIGDDGNDDGDKKIKSSEQKIKFHHRKRRNWSYGTIIR